ncbi:hypothetical protein KFE96_09670 [Kordiimonas sp. SCSIO 12603]|uniref:hypothetical protein n=1 Tax=Kordiimonas sp. SCSIO 12603 TaxID=2829596 RepID=UPI00210774FE|nr:hypothetical protein [Kordiimonas sp. SCSIO 12603]UTW57134.1 hypothetical protein KFE96_09670 [Kordiimonas sp. SCSIO 12603]
MATRFITPTIHGFLDYAAALGLIILPFVFSLADVSPLVHWFSVVTGVGLIAYSLLTDYKFSMKGLFSYKMHLIFDALASAAFILLAFLHEGTIFTMGYCLFMASGVLAVIALSGDEEQVVAAQ